MGKSADVEWQTFIEGSFFIYHRQFGCMIVLTPERTESLHTIIHEINECEVTFALMRIGFKEREMDVHVTKKMCKKYPWVFKHPQKHIIVTHIISPYGVGNCILGRDKNRVVW
jgi:hypothetical protein